MSYYKVIKGISYDRALLEKANHLTQGRGDGRISEKDMQDLYEVAQDGGRITEVEYRTLNFISNNLNATEKAIAWLKDLVMEEKGTDALVEKVIRQRLGLTGLKWTLPEDEIKKQEALDNQQTFEQALFQGVEAFIFEAESSTSLRDVISFETGIPLDSRMEIDQLVREWINDGHLFLVPLNFAQQQEAGTFTFVTPNDGWSPSEFWIFGLAIPNRTNFNFVSLVRRQDFEQAFSFGYIPTLPSSQQAISNIIVQAFQLPGMRWQISSEEIKLQRQLPGSVDFPDALRKAIVSFINDGDEAETVRNIVKGVYEEDVKPEDFEFIWAYEDFITRKVKEFLDDGLLFFVPKGISELNPDDLEEIYPPEGGESVMQHWIFMLQLPTLSDHIYWAIVDRTGEQPTYSYGFN